MVVVERERTIEAPVGSKLPNPDNKYEGYRKTRDFLDAAFMQGANFNVPPGQMQEGWERNLKITLNYYMDISTSTQVMADKLGMTRQNLHRIATTTINQLWHSGSDELRMRFPIEELSLRKPMPLETREKASKLRAGRKGLIHNFMRENPNATFGEIRRATGASWAETNSVLKTLQSLGSNSTVNDREEITFYRNLSLEKRIKKAKTLLEIKTLLNTVDLYFYKRHVKGNAPLLTSITDIMRYAGFHRNSPHFNEFLDVLRRKRIPFRMVEEHKIVEGKEVIARYYFTLSQYKESAKEAFLEERRLLFWLEYPHKRRRDRQNLASSPA